MGEYYNKLQGKYLAVKSKMVEALERLDSTETTARDLKHVRNCAFLVYTYMYMC